MIKTTIHAVGDETEPPISVGNPLTAADLAIDQSHMEEFATDRGRPARCARAPSRRRASSSPCARRPASRGRTARFYFLLEMKDRDPYIVAPAIAKLKKEEDVIRPVLHGALRHDGRRRRLVGAQDRSAGRQGRTPGTGRR